MPVPEPITSAVLGGSVRAAVSQVASLLSGKASKQDLPKVALQYWGCVLFEMRRNLIQVAMVVAQGKPAQGDDVPSLEFSFYEALMGDIARLAPSPLVTAVAGRITANLRAIQRLVAVQVQAGAIPISALAPMSTPLNIGAAWRAYARANVGEDIVSYNQLVGAISVDGQHAYKDEWSTLARTTVPAALPAEVAEAAKATFHGL